MASRRFSREWWNAQPDHARKRATQVGVVLVAYVVVLVVVMTTPPNHPSYYRGHSALFTFSIIATMIFLLAKRSSLASMLRRARLGAAGAEGAGLPEILDGLYLILVTLALVSLAVLVDYSFFIERRVLPIGGVVAAIVMGLTALYRWWRERSS